MPWWNDETPVHCEEIGILELRRRFIRSRKTESHLGVAQQCSHNFRFVHCAYPDMDVWSLVLEFFQHIDQHIAGEVLACHDVNLLSHGFQIASAAKFVGMFEKSQRMWQ